MEVEGKRMELHGGRWKVRLHKRMDKSVRIFSPPQVPLEAVSAKREF